MAQAEAEWGLIKAGLVGALGLSGLGFLALGVTHLGMFLLALHLLPAAHGVARKQFNPLMFAEYVAIAAVGLIGWYFLTGGPAGGTNLIVAGTKDWVTCVSEPGGSTTTYYGDRQTAPKPCYPPASPDPPGMSQETINKWTVHSGPMAAPSGKPTLP